MKAILGATAEHDYWHALQVRAAGTCLDPIHEPTPGALTTPQVEADPVAPKDADRVGSPCHAERIRCADCLEWVEIA